MSNERMNERAHVYKVFQDVFFDVKMHAGIYLRWEHIFNKPASYSCRYCSRGHLIFAVVVLTFPYLRYFSGVENLELYHVPTRILVRAISEVSHHGLVRLDCTSST
jgi:hypothetical protein